MMIPNTLAQDLTAAILNVCPVLGVSLVDINDKNTWIIWFADNATDDQKTAAQTALQNFDTSSYQ